MAFSIALKKAVMLRRVWLLAVLWIPGLAAAWGTLGHQAIAAMAERQLTPAAHEVVRGLLAQEGASRLMDVAMWADKVKPERPDLPSHMVRIPLSREVYDARRDCLKSGKLCIVMGLERAIARLRDASSPPLARLEALKLVVHFTGDIHQPLHTCTRTGQLAMLGGKARSMHAIWDTQSVKLFGMKAEPLADALLRDAPEILQGGPEDWANEGHRVALEYFRPWVAGRAKDEAIFLPDDYLTSIQPVIRARLQQAGVRLARVLNQALER